MSGLEEAIDHVVGPNFAPFFKKTWIAGTFPQSIARSNGRRPFKSTCSIFAPRSSNSLTTSAEPLKF